MENLVVLLGAVVILIGILLILIGSLMNGEKSEIKVGFGGFIGPIPFGFANEKGMLCTVIVLIAVTLAVYLLLGQKFV